MTRTVLLSIVAAASVGISVIIPANNAEAASCSRRVSSKNSDTPVTVNFVNRSGEYRSVMWVDFKGKWKNHANLNPGENFIARTFVTHPWIFTDGPGNCIEMFMPQKGIMQFNISRKSTGAGGD